MIPSLSHCSHSICCLESLCLDLQGTDAFGAPRTVVDFIFTTDVDQKACVTLYHPRDMLFSAVC